MESHGSLLEDVFISHQSSVISVSADDSSVVDDDEGVSKSLSPEKSLQLDQKEGVSTTCIRLKFDESACEIIW